MFPWNGVVIAFLIICVGMGLLYVTFGSGSFHERRMKPWRIDSRRKVISWIWLALILWCCVIQPVRQWQKLKAYAERRDH